MPSRQEESISLGGNADNVLVADMGSRLAVIVTHPWGVLGGSMHNNVVVAATLFFQKIRVTTVRFDFSGTQIGRGYVQTDQVKKIAQAVLDGKCMSKRGSTSTATNPPPQYILLVGYSYGALIAASASADIPSCVGIISIAPPFAVQHWLLLFQHNYHLTQAVKREDLPRLLVIGSNDNFTSESSFRSVVQERFPPECTTGAVLKGADHFFGRRERDLMDVIAQWLLTTYSQCQGDLKQLRNLEFGLQSSSTSSLSNAHNNET